MKVRIIASINLWDKRQPDPDPDIAVQRHELSHRATTSPAGAPAATSTLISSRIRSARARACAAFSEPVRITKPCRVLELTVSGSTYVGMRKIVVIGQWFRNRWEARFHLSTGKVFLSAG